MEPITVVKWMAIVLSCYSLFKLLFQEKPLDAIYWLLMAILILLVFNTFTV